jgi:hypothetical protein
MSCHTLPRWSMKAELSEDKRNEENPSRDMTSSGDSEDAESFPVT